MLFIPLGASDAIGASCYYARLDGSGVLLDAGADPERDGVESLPQLDVLRANPEWRVDHIIVTHAHHDHIGSLPVLMREFPHARVHLTRETRALAELLLPASARLQRRRQDEGRTSLGPLFNEDEAEALSYLYCPQALGEAFDISSSQAPASLTSRFYHAGHVLGSAGIEMELGMNGQSRRIFYTSDTNARAQSIIPGADYPTAPVDVLIIESTMGADAEAEHTTRRMQEAALGEAIRRTLDRKGAVLLPVFALGRAQEVLALIGRFKRRGQVPDDTPVYTAGMMRAVSDLYDRTRYDSPRLNPEFSVFDVAQARLPRRKSAKADALRGPGIHVVSSGMMFERTISNQLAQMIIEKEENAVFLVGYARDDSPAARLLAAAETGGGTPVVLSEAAGAQPVHCEVRRFRLSGHSHRRDLLGIVERIKPRKVVLVHGEPKARTWMHDNIRFFNEEIEVVLPTAGEPLQL